MEQSEKRKDLAAAQGNPLIQTAIAISRSCNYEEGHAERARRVALLLFDQLTALHKLGPEERNLLQAAALLHDAGWVNGRSKHHKTSLEIIVRSTELPLPEKRRIMLGLIARYHRKSLPDNSHKYYSELDAGSKSVVSQLASLLRVADGLDKSRASLIEALKCEISADLIVISVWGSKVLQEDIKAGQMKTDLMEKFFHKEVCVRRGREQEPHSPG